jgi:hypothetical protein
MESFAKEALKATIVLCGATIVLIIIEMFDLARYDLLYWFFVAVILAIMIRKV